MYEYPLFRPLAGVFIDYVAIENIVYIDLDQIP